MKKLLNPFNAINKKYNKLRKQINYEFLSIYFRISNDKEENIFFDKKNCDLTGEDRKKNVFDYPERNIAISDDEIAFAVQSTSTNKLFILIYNKKDKDYYKKDFYELSIDKQVVIINSCRDIKHLGIAHAHEAALLTDYKITYPVKTDWGYVMDCVGINSEFFIRVPFEDEDDFSFGFSNGMSVPNPHLITIYLSTFYDL